MLKKAQWDRGIRTTRIYGLPYDTFMITDSAMVIAYEHIVIQIKNITDVTY